MPTLQNTSYEDQARKALEDDPHYVTTVAKMGDVKHVVTDEEVFTTKGMKLLDKGIAIGSGLRERLLQHKLMKPIDQSLTVADCVTAASLATEASRLLDAQPYLRQLFPLPADQESAAAALAQLELPAQMAFKLTVAREQLPHLFEHVLVVALICHYLSLHLRLTGHENKNLLMAALLHDLGELHTAPALLEQGHQLNRDEMRYIYAHPITGYLIAKVVAAENPEVAAAVLQHQERLDGSGYPYGLRGESTSLLARIISVADVCSSILSRFGNSTRLSALLRLNHQKFTPALIALMQKAFGVLEDDEAIEESAVLPQLKAVAQLIKHWGDFSASLAGGSGPPPELAFLFERMVNLNLILVQFGFDPNSLQLLRTVIAEDRKIAGELAAALDEVRWQFADLEREIVRHKEIAAAALPIDKSTFLEDWLADLRHYLEAAAAQAQ